jgi:translation initiation factor 2 gamma subunit (eIF-2gamma)
MVSEAVVVVDTVVVSVPGEGAQVQLATPSVTNGKAAVSKKMVNNWLLIALSLVILPHHSHVNTYKTMAFVRF